MKITWVTLGGPVTYSGAEIIFDPSIIDKQPDIPAPPTYYGQTRSSVYFKEGRIDFDVTLSSPKDSATIMLSTTNGTVAIGINVNGPTYGAAIFENGSWRTLGGSGWGQLLSTDRPYHVTVEVQGSKISLFIDTVKTAEFNWTTIVDQLTFQFTGLERIKVNNFHCKTEVPTCFIVMQFSPEYDDLYNHVIKPVCERNGYSAIRADDFANSGLILNDIISSIRNSAVIIADITPDNANVYYEVGFAHGIGKPTILMSDKSRQRLPFDLAGFRTLFYSNSIGGKQIIEDHLERHLKEISQPTNQWPSVSAGYVLHPANPQQSGKRL